MGVARCQVKGDADLSHDEKPAMYGCFAHTSEDHLEAIRSQPFKKLIVSGEHDLLVREHHAHALRDHLDADFYVIEGCVRRL